MSFKLSQKQPADSDTLSTSSVGRVGLSFWLLRLGSLAADSWEAYLILLVAAFLRFYQINTTEFDDDQAKIYRMAYDAVHRGLLPTTSDVASIGIAHPPGLIYLFMPIAALSANPLGGAVLTAFFTSVAALLTYFFTRRYYGRFAAIAAALLYATAARPLNYARFIWQPNLMPPFVVLFIFALYWGVVERRKGWLFPALFLLGVLYQMHPTTLLLAIPLFVAVVLAPGTVRWRDLAFTVVSLLVIFLPYLLWEAFTHFADVRTVFSLAKQQAHTDSQALGYYRLFLIPYDRPPTNTATAVGVLAPILSWLIVAVPVLTLGGFLTAGIVLLRSEWHGVRRWWMDLRANPSRCGLLVLLSWQIVPLLILSRHAVDLHAQYFLMFMPGPFILIGFFLATTATWFGTHGVQWHDLRYGRYAGYVRYAVYAILACVFIAQLSGSTAAVIDASSGNFNDRSFHPYPYHNDLRSLQHALGEADQLAQQRHISRVYITTDFATQTALRYLAEQMHTPSTLFDASRCLVLPNPVNGPAVLLVGPYDELTNALLKQFATTTLVDQPAHLGGAPFRLYVVAPALAISSQKVFTGNLQLLDMQAQHLDYNGSSWLVTRWSLLHGEQPSFRTTYSYALGASFNGGQNGLGGQSRQSRQGGLSVLSRQSVCTFTAIRAGDQLLAAFNLPIGGGAGAGAMVTLKAQAFTVVPNNPFYGPFHLETDRDHSTAKVVLRTVDGGDALALPGSKTM